MLHAIAWASRSQIAEYSPQELANTVWSFATLGVLDIPLMAAISAAAIQKIDSFSPQHITNTAWSFAELFFWIEPLMTAISSEALRRISGLRFGDAHTLLWSLEKGSDFSHCWTLLQHFLAGGMTTDVLDFGVLLLSCEAFRGARYESLLWNLICTKTPVRRDMQEILAGVAGGARRYDAWVGKDSVELVGAQVARHGGHAQHKLAMLVQHLEATISRGPGLAAKVLEEVVEFSLKKFNYWLKVAADTKATLIDNVLEHAGRARHRIRLELGAFVGFSGLRLSGAVAISEEVLDLQSWRVISLEVDPLHVCVARHVLNLGERSSVAEVRTGQVRDLLPRIFEERGELSLGLAFMDHRGTRFHDEMYLLERQLMTTSQMDVICDNVLHPGAPVFLWEETQRGTSREATVWSLPEFGGEGCIEDWMAFERYEPRQFDHISTR